MNLLNPQLPTRSQTCPAPAVLEALSAGEPQSAEVTAHVPACAECRAYVASLEHGGEAFLALRPPEQFLRKLERREATAAASRRPWLFGIGAALVAGLAFFVVQPPDTSSGVRTKGAPFGVVYLRHGADTPQVVGPDARLQAGDALRFFYEAPQPGHLLVIDLDSTGKASVFVPFDGTHSLPISAGSKEMLPGSVVLDAAPGEEWLVAVYSKGRLEAAPLLKQLEAQRGSSAPSLSCDGCTVTTLRIQKKP